MKYKKEKNNPPPKKHADLPPVFPTAHSDRENTPSELFLLTAPAFASNVNICSAYFQTSSGITIKRGSGFHSSVSHGEPPSSYPGCISAMRPFIPFMGSGWLTSSLGGGGLSVPSPSSVKHVAHVPGSADRCPGDLC